MLQLAAGFAPVTNSSVAFNGRPVRDLGADRVVVSQWPWLYHWLNLRDHVTFDLRLHSRKTVTEDGGTT